MEGAFTPAELMTIEDLETLKVVSDPLRNQIIELFSERPRTVKQVADRLGLSPNKLYYHINLLEKHNIIRVVETRIVSGIIEKHYWLTARNFDVAHELLNFGTPEGKENINAILAATLETTHQDMLRSLEARAFELEQGAPENPRQVIILRQVSRLSKEQAKEFAQRLAELLKDFEAAGAESAKSEATEARALTIAYYPTFYYGGDEAEEQATNDGN